MFDPNRPGTQCPLCDGSDGELFQADGVHEAPGVDVWVCQTHSIAWQNPLPSQEVITKYYRETYRTEGAYTYTPLKNYEKQQSLSQLRWDRYMHEFFSPEVIALDVACGTGNMMRLVSEAGGTVDGIEAYEPYAEMAREFGTVQTTMVEDMVLARPYNTVLLIHILEHLRNPSALLEHIGRHLSAGARLFVECPNLRNVMIGGYKYNVGVPRFHRPHLWEFTPESMLTLLEAHGWIPESVVPYQRGGLTNHLWDIFRSCEGLPPTGQAITVPCRKEVKEGLVHADVAYRHILEKAGLTDTFLIRAVHP